MKQIPNLREFFYPLEWFFRFAFLDMFIIIISGLYPLSLLFYLAYYVAIVAMIIALVIQLYYIWNWLKEKKSEPLKNKELLQE